MLLIQAKTWLLVCRRFIQLTIPAYTAFAVLTWWRYGRDGRDGGGQDQGLAELGLPGSKDLRGPWGKDQ
jgi:hypothetical protein